MPIEIHIHHYPAITSEPLEAVVGSVHNAPAPHSPDSDPIDSAALTDRITDVPASFFAPARPTLRERLRTRLVDAAVAKGASPIAAGLAVNQLASERPLLDWLLDGGWEKLLALVLELIKLLG